MSLKSKGVDRGGLTTRYPKEYAVWHNMIHRTTNPYDKWYEWYGLDGIRCCNRWRRNPNGFQNFIEDMGPRPAEADGTPYQLDRVDGSGPYAPWNCRWTTAKVNQQNKLTTVWYTDPFDGERLCQTDIAKKYNIGRKTLWFRLRAGWPLADALITQPLKLRRKYRKGLQNERSDRY